MRLNHLPVQHQMAHLSGLCHPNETSIHPLWLLEFRGAKEDLSRSQRGGFEVAKRTNRANSVNLPWFSTSRHTAFRRPSQKQVHFRGKNAVRHIVLRNPSHRVVNTNTFLKIWNSSRSTFALPQMHAQDLWQVPYKKPGAGRTIVLSAPGQPSRYGLNYFM